MMSKEQFHEDIFSKIRRVELHEMEEFFKINGKHFIDPHAGEK